MEDTSKHLRDRSCEVTEEYSNTGQLAKVSREHPQRKTKKKLLVILLTVPVGFAWLVAVCGGSSVAASAVTTSQTPSVYYGVHVPGGLNTLNALTTFENDAKKTVSLVMFYQGWGLTDGTQNFETDWMNNVRNHGSIPMVTWEPWLYTNGTNQPQYSLQNIINGTFDAYITKWANDSKTWGHPYFLRFAAEMNGNWFPWSEQVNGNQPGQYAPAWRHVHTLFVNDGVTNVTWVWSPNIEYNGSTPLGELYPGDSYVDWLGMDGYNWGTVNGHGWQTFSQVFSQTYHDILGISTKPLMIAETASTEQGGNKANWITDAYTTQMSSNFPNIKAIIWFNENKETDWRIESSSTAQTAFATAIQSSRYTSNNYASLNASPIPPPSPSLSPSPSPSPSPTVTMTPSPSPTPGTILAQDTFQRPNQALWGTASDGHTWGGDANVQSAFSIVNNTGQISTGNGIYNALLGSTASDAEVLFSGSMSSFSNANLGAVLRWSDTNNWYKAYITGTSLVVQKKVNGATTVLGSVPFTATSGTSYTLRFRVVGTTLYARVWQTGTPEPTTWMITVTDTSFSSGYCGLRMLAQNGATARYTSFLATAQ